MSIYNCDCCGEYSVDTDYDTESLTETHDGMVCRSCLDAHYIGEADVSCPYCNCITNKVYVSIQSMDSVESTCSCECGAEFDADFNEDEIYWYKPKKKEGN